MRTESAQDLIPPSHPGRRLGRSVVDVATRRFYWWDVLGSAAALIALVEHFRARAAYSTFPLFALIVPAFLCALSTGYRRRAVGWSRGEWARVEAYSAGGGAIPWLATAIFAIAPAWLLGLSNQRTLGAIDTKPVVPTAISLITQGNWELGEYMGTGLRRVNLLDRQGRVPLCFQVRPRGIYSSYPAGMVPFAVVVAAISASFDANLDSVEVHRHLEKMTASIVSAASIGLFFLIALRLAPARSAWVSTAILAVSSGMFSTVSMGLWQHGGIILWSLIILLVEFRREEVPTRWDPVIQGFACAQLVTCRLTSVAFLVPFGLWVLVRSPKRAVLVVAFAGLAYLPWSWAYWNTYGNLFGPSTGFLAGGLWSVDVSGPLAGVLFSPGRGLIVYQPWVLLAMAVAVPSVRARLSEVGRVARPSGWVPFCLVAIASQVLLVSAWGCWWGGWCWGSRLVVDIVPLCALLCVRPIAALWTSRGGRALVLSMALLGLLAHLPAAYFNAVRWNATAHFPEDVWSWTHSPLTDWRPGP